MDMDEDRIDALARQLYLKWDTQYDHRIVRWYSKGENGLAQYDPNTYERYRELALDILKTVDKIDELNKGSNRW